MNEEILKRMVDADRLVAPDAAVLLQSLENPGEVADQLLKENAPVITVQLIQEILKKKEEEKIPLPVEVIRSSGFKPLAKEFEPDLKELRDKEVTGKSKCTGGVEDFVFYFQDRFKRLERMLLSHRSNAATLPISSLKKEASARDVRIIGMVADKRVTKNGHILVDLESEDSLAKVLFIKSDREPLRTTFQNASSLLFDEVIAVEGRLRESLFIASSLAWPDVPPREQRRSERDLCIAFASDIHVGSKNFLEGNFRQLVNWLNGGGTTEEERQLAGKIKYLFIAGDAVDGVGVYPNQENELTIPDFYAQYSAFCGLLQQLPDYIEIVVIPGNHDGLRRAEPQPALEKDLLKDFQAPNIHFLGNPSQLEVEGLRALLYHGTSLDSIIASVPGLTYNHPEKPMAELLKRRNLSPIYGDNPIVPEHRDYLVIDEAPDILHMGHVHKNGVDQYKGTFLINAGTWQARTEFQTRMGHVPTPCLLPVYNLHSLKLDVVNFQGESHA